MENTYNELRMLIHTSTVLSQHSLVPLCTSHLCLTYCYNKNEHSRLKSLAREAAVRNSPAPERDLSYTFFFFNSFRFVFFFK